MSQNTNLKRLGQAEGILVSRMLWLSEGGGAGWWEAHPSLPGPLPGLQVQPWTFAEQVCGHSACGSSPPAGEGPANTICPLSFVWSWLSGHRPVSGAETCAQEGPGKQPGSGWPPKGVLRRAVGNSGCRPRRPLPHRPPRPERVTDALS